jgi:hypothetical protein
MFPNTDDAPTETAQFTRHLTVTFAIPGDFGVPKFPVRVRAAITPGATVPETAVHKEREPHLSENEIRFAKHGLISLPAGDVVTAKKSHQSKLGVHVATPTNPGHDIGSFCLCKNVSHSLIC